jgi:hypothetical protein
MKKFSIVYTSYKGNTRFIAQQIADSIGGTLVEIQLKRDIPAGEFVQFIRGHTYEQRKGRLILMDHPLPDKSVDLIFLGTPVWAHTASPAVQGYLLNNLPAKIPIAFFYCHGGKPEGILDEVEMMVPTNPLISHCGFQSPLMHESESAAAKAKEWARDCVNIS